MPGRQEILEDLRDVDQETDSILDPNQYDFLGDFSFEEVISKFGTWQEALNEAEISLKDKIAKDVQRVRENVEDPISQPEYLKHGNYPFSKIQQEFGKWNNLKESLGLSTHERNVPDEKIEEDMKRVAEQIDHPLTTKRYYQLGEYSPMIFAVRDYSFAEFRDKIGLEAPKSRGYPSKEALRAWKEELIDVKGRFSADELKDRLSSTDHDYSTAYRKSLQEYLKEKGFQFTVSKSGKGSKYYIKGPEALTLKEYYQQFLDKIPKEKEEWFMEMSGTGPSPRSIVAAIRYLTEDETQTKIADEEGVSEVSLRNTRQKIVEKFDLDEDAGKEAKIL